MYLASRRSLPKVFLLGIVLKLEYLWKRRLVTSNKKTVIMCECMYKKAYSSYQWLLLHSYFWYTIDFPVFVWFSWKIVSVDILFAIMNSICKSINCR